MLKFLFDLCAFPFRLSALIFCLPIQAGVSFYEKANAKRHADDCPLFKDIPEKSTVSNIDAAWPPAPHAVEALSVQELINANGKLIRDICYATTLNDEDTQRFLLPVITNLARIVHLCPASEFDHHQGYGGLFTHSLETAYFAANSAKNKIFDRSAPPQDQYFNKCRWILTAVLAALVHDIGKPFSDMEITTDDGKRWDHQSPILDWLRRNRIASYYIAFKQSREHNVHKSFSLSKSALLIPQKTWDFISLTGYGEIMMKEFNDAVLLGNKGGLIGRILDNADGISRNLDMKRQRQIKAEFKNISHPQANELLKAIRSLIAERLWQTNSEDGRVFVTKQGCFVVWNEAFAAQAREKAQSQGAVSIPLDYIRLAAMLAEIGVTVRNTDEVSNTFNLFWQVTPIVLGTTQLTCIRISNPQLIFDAAVPPAIEALVEGIAADDDTKAAWMRKWKFVPKVKLTRQEEEQSGYTEDYAQQLVEEAAVREQEREDLSTAEAAVSESEDVWAEMLEERAESEKKVEIKRTVTNAASKIESLSEELPKVKHGIDESGFDMAALMGTALSPTPTQTKAEPEVNNGRKQETPLDSVSETESVSVSEFSTSDADVTLETVPQLPEQKPAAEQGFDTNLTGLLPPNEEQASSLVQLEPAAKPQTGEAEVARQRADRGKGSRKAKKDGRTEGEIVFEQTRNLVRDMAQQICLRSGLWLEGGRQMDVETGKWFTGSRLFEQELEERGVAESMFRLVIDEMQERDEQPRIELDRQRHRVYLITNGELD